MEKSRPISSFINKELRGFSLYVCYHRAIPSLVDGFKPSQRKAFYVLKGKRELTKVMSVAGMMISQANYNHGDAAASDTVSRMTQDFVGSNNIPAFVGKGSFGSKFIKESSAPRYVFVKPNPSFYGLFRDFELCEPDEDPENPEPRYFLPVVPTVLLNGVAGIAVGFATKIFPYSLRDVVANIRRVLDNKVQMRMTPYFEGYTGTVDWEDGKPVMHGCFKVTGPNDLVVTEVPVSYDREQYNKMLAGLEENSFLSSVRDKSKTQWEVHVSVPARGKWKLPGQRSKGTDDLEGKLGLREKLNENITVIDENGALRVFDDARHLIKHFVEFRLGVYAKRIRFRLGEIRDEASLTMSKIKFVGMMQGVDFGKTTKARIVSMLESAGFSNEHVEACMRMPASNLNSDYVAAKRDRLAELKKEFDYYKKVTPKELYLIDLDEIEKGA